MATLYDPDNQLARTPPMGWNSYNAFGGTYFIPQDVTPDLPGGIPLEDRIIRETADALVSSGLAAAGYTYLNIDDRWQNPITPRDGEGRLQYDERRFPHGIKALADYVHNQGLKFGLYTVANELACGGEEGSGPSGIPYTGSLGHEFIDALTFAEWGVDFLKIDWCGVHEAGTHGRAADIFRIWNQAIAETGRPIVLSASTWGHEDEAAWGPLYTHLWRTTADFEPRWSDVLRKADENSAAALRAVCGPTRGWNDPDMMHVGNPGLSLEESRAHFSLWAIMASPLLAGNDVRQMSDAVQAILSNPEVIAVNQDVLGVQGWPSSEQDGLQVWYKPLHDGACAVLGLNRTEQAARIRIDFEALGREPVQHIRDLWQRADCGVYSQDYAAQIAAHDVVMLRLGRP